MKRTPFCIIVIACFFYLLSPAQKITLLFAGDAMQHQSQIDNAYRNGKYDYSSYFKHIQYEVSNADLAIVNLEVTLGGEPYKGYPMFSAPDEYAIALKDAGFDLFLTANNHILDRHSKGLHRTLNVLDSLNVKHTGVFRSLKEREQVYPLIIEEKGIKIAILNYTYATNGIKPSGEDFVNYIDRKQIVEDIRKSESLSADIIIANMHWGDEYKMLPNKVQENTAKFLIDEGVDIVMGSHPHVVQPSQVTRDSEGNISHLTVYSLGNLVSAMRAENTDGGQLIKIELEKEGTRTKINSCGYILVYVYKEKKGTQVDFSVLPVLMAEGKLPLMYPAIKPAPEEYTKMKRFANNARSILDKHNVGVEEYRILHPKKDTVWINFPALKFVK